MLTQDLLHELFEYEEGELVWKVNRGVNKLIGKPAGAVTSKGYLQVSISNRNYYVHRLVFMYHRGHLPKFLDHVDGDPLNNRIENLRECTSSQNGCNARKPTNNSSGLKGVSYYAPASKWRAAIRYEGTLHHGGYYETRDLANNAAIALREKLHGEFCRHD